MITVDNYEVETCGSIDTVTEDLKVLVNYLSSTLLYEMHVLVIQELKDRDAKNNTSN